MNNLVKKFDLASSLMHVQVFIKNCIRICQKLLEDIANVFFLYALLGFPSWLTR